MQAYETFCDPPTAQSEDIILSLRNASPTDTTTGREFDVTARINTRQSDKITRK